MRVHLLYTILAAAVLALAAVPVGVAVFVLGFVQGDSPCVMCWEQRIGMALIALTGLFILRYGPKPQYIGTAIVVGAYGMFMGLRHVGMHAARDIGQGFSIEILGAHTYTWAVAIYWISVVTMGLLLTLMRKEDIDEGPRRLRPLGALAGLVLVVVLAANAVQAFASTGPPPFAGQGDPVRFSWRPSEWVWSMEEWSPLPIGLRGRWAVEKPVLASLPADPAAGPFPALPALPVRQRVTLTMDLRGAPTDLAYDAAGDRFLLTTGQGVYLTDGSLARRTRYTVVDPGYSVDLGEFAGAAFLEAGSLLAVGQNKSYVVLRPSDTADATRNVRFFLESFDHFEELSRSRFGTVRARMMYVMSAAFDPATLSVYTVTVPNSKVKRLVVSRFDRRDMTLSEEFVPTLAESSGLVLAPRRSLDEFYVTGATIAGGRLYAISAAYHTLLTLDLATRSVVAAHAVDGLSRPVGLAARGHDLYVLSEDRVISIVPRPEPTPLGGR